MKKNNNFVGNGVRKTASDIFWGAIVDEIQNKSKRSFISTSISNKKGPPLSKRGRLVSKEKHFIGDEYPNVYFTEREAQCMLNFLDGRTMKKAAEKMQLSPRTVEYYLKTMKLKLNCKNKFDLIKKVANTNFLESYSKEKRSNP